MKQKTNTRLSERIILIVVLKSVFLALTFGSVAKAQTNEDQTVVRGEPALKEHLTLGPEQTELWRQIQVVASKPALIVDLANIVPVFDLRMSDAVDLVTPQKPGRQTRNDLKSGHLQWMIERISYGILTPALRETSPRDVFFGMQLNLRGICLSPIEIRKNYGSGVIFIPSHGYVPAISYTEPDGLEFSEKYQYHTESSRQTVTFSYANSGCLVGFEIHASLSN